MFQQILFTQWKSFRLGLIPFAIAAFGLPLLAVQGLGPVPEGSAGARVGLQYLFDSWQFWLPWFPALAVTVGATAALNAWSWDHKTDHIYALSLPISRPRYAAWKMGAGALLVVVPALGLWLGALAASASIDVPASVNTYPTALAVRFLLASILAYSVFFALAAGTIRTTVIVLSSFAGIIILTAVMTDYASAVVPGFAFDFNGWFVESLLEWPGPFEVLSGNWSLIDV